MNATKKSNRSVSVHISPEAREPLFAVALFSKAPFAEVVAIGLNREDADAMVKTIDEGPDGYTAGTLPMAWKIALPRKSRSKITSASIRLGRRGAA